MSSRPCCAVLGADRDAVERHQLQRLRHAVILDLHIDIVSAEELATRQNSCCPACISNDGRGGCSDKGSEHSSATRPMTARSRRAVARVGWQPGLVWSRMSRMRSGSPATAGWIFSMPSTMMAPEPRPVRPPRRCRGHAGDTSTARAARWSGIARCIGTSRRN